MQLQMMFDTWTADKSMAVGCLAMPKKRPYMPGTAVIARRRFHIFTQDGIRTEQYYTRVFQGVVVDRDNQNPPWYTVRLGNGDLWWFATLELEMAG